MKNVIYKVELDKRNEFGQFNKTVIEDNVENVYLSVSKYREENKDSNVRYVAGHVK